MQQQGLLEDLLGPKSETWTTFPTTPPGLFPSFTTYDEEEDILLSSSSSFTNSTSFLQLISSSSFIHPTFQTNYNPSYEHQHYEYDDKPRSLVPVQEAYKASMVEDDGATQSQQADDQTPTVFSVGLSGEKKNRSKKAEGQPSKNLMAERRRRKRLNDRLSMLRSIVPKISKMDRTSILGDTIDYVNELLEKINDLKEQEMESDVDHLKLVGGFKEFNMNEGQLKNPPKFDVERRKTDTQIQICCSTKPGMLFSTVNTIEALGLDIQQCVISCFSDFSVQASCCEAQEHQTMISCEDMKQILFRNAGYGGRCL